MSHVRKDTNVSMVLGKLSTVHGNDRQRSRRHDRYSGHLSPAALETPNQLRVHGVRHCAAARPAHSGSWQSAERAQPVVCAGICVRGSAGAVFDRTGCQSQLQEQRAAEGKHVTLRTRISRMR